MSVSVDGGEGWGAMSYEGSGTGLMGAGREQSLLSCFRAPIDVAVTALVNVYKSQNEFVPNRVQFFARVISLLCQLVWFLIPFIASHSEKDLPVLYV